MSAPGKPFEDLGGLMWDLQWVRIAGHTYKRTSLDRAGIERMASALASSQEEIARLRKALEEIGEFFSGDDTTLGAIKRLSGVRSIAARALASKEGAA